MTHPTPHSPAFAWQTPSLLPSSGQAQHSGLRVDNASGSRHVCRHRASLRATREHEWVVLTSGIWIWFRFTRILLFMNEPNLEPQLFDKQTLPLGLPCSSKLRTMGSCSLQLRLCYQPGGTGESTGSVLKLDAPVCNQKAVLLRALEPMHAFVCRWDKDWRWSGSLYSF
jgi:hypothetical protein